MKHASIRVTRGEHEGVAQRGAEVEGEHDGLEVAQAGVAETRVAGVASLNLGEGGNEGHGAP